MCDKTFVLSIIQVSFSGHLNHLNIDECVVKTRAWPGQTHPHSPKYHPCSGQHSRRFSHSRRRLPAVGMLVHDHPDDHHQKKIPPSRPLVVLSARSPAPASANVLVLLLVVRDGDRRKNADERIEGCHGHTCTTASSHFCNPTSRNNFSLKKGQRQYK